MDSHLELAGCFSQPAEERLVISIVAEYRLAIDASLDDLMRLVGNDESRESGHGGNANDPWPAFYRAARIMPVAGVTDERWLYCATAS